jgi:hypothetical protein
MVSHVVSTRQSHGRVVGGKVLTESPLPSMLTVVFVVLSIP